MIYLGFVFDFLICAFLPFNSYLVVSDIEDNSIFEVILVGILLDTLFGHFLFNTIILLVLYFITKMIKVKNKYIVFKNIIVFTIYYGLMNSLVVNNMMVFNYVVCLFVQLLYLYISNVLLNSNHNI